MDTSTAVPPSTGPEHQYLRLVCSHCGEVIDVPKYCGNRFCAVCGSGRRIRLRQRLDAIISQFPKKEGYRTRFVTLTLPSGRDAVAGLDRLLSSFRKLRQRKWWRDRVWGGIAVTEITVNNGRFHVHLHCVLLSHYLPQHQLSRVFTSCGGGPICDVRLADNAGLAGYLTKYATKSSVPEDYRSHLSIAYRNRRLYTAFGEAHDIEVEIPKKNRSCPRCEHQCFVRLDAVIESFRHINSS